MLRRFRQGLLRWYGRHQRELPWRRTRDPTRAGLGDHAPQTRVDRVIPKYHEFLGRYPTLEALATATSPTSRGRGIPSATRPPCTSTASRARRSRIRRPAPGRRQGSAQSMKGIGRYTAGAVRSVRLARAPPSSTRTSGRPRPRVPRPGRRPTQQRLLATWPSSSSRGRGCRLQPGPDGFGAPLVHRAEADLLPCPMRRLPRYPWTRADARRDSSGKRPDTARSLGRLVRRIQACRACPTMRAGGKSPRAPPAASTRDSSWSGGAGDREHRERHGGPAPAA